MKQIYSSLEAVYRQPLTIFAIVLVANMLFGVQLVFALGAESDHVVVGEVSLVLGKAYVQNLQGRRELIKVGSSITVGDSIETSTNGHVHMRFIDQALVSLRPSSKLEVVRYDYIADAPEASVVKFNLVEGITRAISGEAAHEARKNFRMNTPIAAIGVRGTDFVVSANRNSVRALVYEGSIIVAPFSSECSADAFGPCNQNALELAGGASQIIEISSDDLNPTLLPLSSAVPDTLLSSAEQLPASESAEREEKEDGLFSDSVSRRVVNIKLEEARSMPPTEVALGADVFTPDAPVELTELANNQLIWGRYAGSGSQVQRITAPYENEVTTSGREVTVANNAYFLFRAESGSKAVQPNLGLIGFSLAKTQAYYHSAAGAELMDVYGGVLTIDFDLNRFSTSLDLGHTSTGKVNFSESGIINSYGYFHNVRRPEINVAGAVSLDGAEAGYFFDKTLENGVIEGLTLWVRQP
jgi:hypothetical protein